MNLRSPVTGLPLVADTAHSLTDGAGNRWPLVDGIPFLRVKREDLVRETLARLDTGDAAGATVELLRDADDWWNEAPPERADVAELLRNLERMNLREAMAALGFSRVGDYFAYRWSDPTYLSGLGLMGAHWNAPATAFELACGIGHFLRVLQNQGVETTGIDVVFSKLWVARRFVLEKPARLLCCDAAAPWPLDGGRCDLTLCQDAFYFLEPKAEILARLRGLVADGGSLLIGHLHNRDAANHSAGAAMTVDEIAAMFPRAVVYDDAELTRAAAEGREPRPQPLTDLRNAEAVALAEGPATARAVDLVSAPVGPVRRNPLYVRSDGFWRIRWPSERYRNEYAELSTFPLVEEDDEGPTPHNLRRRVFVDLPERW